MELEGLILAEGEREADLLDEGDKLELALELGLREALRELDGLRDALGEREAEGLSDGLAEVPV